MVLNPWLAKLILCPPAQVRCQFLFFFGCIWTISAIFIAEQLCGVGGRSCKYSVNVWTEWWGMRSRATIPCIGTSSQRRMEYPKLEGSNSWLCRWAPKIQTLCLGVLLKCFLNSNSLCAVYRFNLLYFSWTADKIFLPVERHSAHTHWLGELHLHPFFPLHVISLWLE